MDRKGWIGLILCILGLFAWEWYVYSRYGHMRPPPKVAQNAAQKADSPEELQLPTTGTGAAAKEEGSEIRPKESFPAPGSLPPEETAVLENAEMKVTFTSWGAAIRSIELKNQRAHGEETLVLNRFSREPIMNLTGWDEGMALVAYRCNPEGKEIVFSRTLANGVELRRRYRLDQEYKIRLEQQWANPAPREVTLPRWKLFVGLGEPIHRQDPPATIAANWLTSQGKYGRIGLPDFSPAGLLGLQWRGARSEIDSPIEPLRWVAVKSQFYAMVLLPPGTLLPDRLFCAREPLLDFPGGGKGQPPSGLDAWASFPEIVLPPVSSLGTTFSFFAGPKEYSLLKSLGPGVGRIMDYGFWGWIVKPLLWCMVQLHKILPNYGVVIIVFTMAIKAIFWPLQSAANRHMKEMQALNPRIKELQAKYKDQPDKMQAEMMKLYREFGVNPVGGCLPVVVQVPIFIGFYTMLQSSVELRHQSFLWIHDLTRPDTVATLPLLGLDINPLPLIMVGTQIVLARMNSPQAENPQTRMMQWMPVFFLAFFYNFASALPLYWTVNNLVSIGQTYWNLRKPVPTLHRVKKQKTPRLPLRK
ncbi:Membrane protein insertase YidC [Methylacidimicrobium cyclopophantes]|uniref:Membrane protein insertase YidC n=1 Tax=Methylacidimicrobium cyclopophantes TaxID=1041766 RepID=A0A5E6MBG2_9BACT|nr:membrane protein insertase YidC [Methylacidimicrobium cyclopophantes]VVM05644.1 Membrane protein insertase YidC [Methylacidimicrobium cyclopophantes]